ncbi:MAG: proline--tRNA ligase [Pseudomonadota bacterium]
MRTTQLNLSTLKETPAEAEIVSHQLMLRAGLIRRLSSGLFTWLPIGYRVLRKVEQVVREEMDRAGALEILMPTVQPSELWQESGRWDKYGSLLLRMNDRHDRDFCFGPTHEEVVTDIARRELKSYKQLPVTYYQIQTKFRDEIRPRFGVMRAREFLMKDAYSFHTDQASLETTYAQMATAYAAVFTRLGLTFRAVDADSGDIGGSRSQEFHVLAETGEDALAVAENGDYAANVEAAPTFAPAQAGHATAELARIETPGAKRIADVAKVLDVAPTDCVKTLIVAGTDGPVALVLRGDHELNTVKAEKLAGVATPLSLADDTDIRAATGAEPGSIGPIGLQLPTYVDHAAFATDDFVCGANETGWHYRFGGWERDTAIRDSVDLRNVVAGDPAPENQGPLSLVRGIEVGHIFQLGDVYTRAMNAAVQDADGQERVMTMGCYGIGVSRIVAAAIEQNHDARGIIWPGPMAPWQVVLVPINQQRSADVAAAAEALYDELLTAGFDVLLDDRDARPGAKFADAELIGIPHRVVVSDRGLKAGRFEYRTRRSTDSEDLDRESLLARLNAEILL